VRDYAAAKGIGDVKVALEQGMEEKAKEFKEGGAQIYKKA